MTVLPDQLSAIHDGRAVADLSARRKVLVHGSDARAWLHDLLTADVEALDTGRTAVALLLSPTGRIRAAVSVASMDDGFLLVQDPAQPEPIDRLLAPYVLSSSVALQDVTPRWTLVAVSGEAAPAVGDTAVLTPSVLGWTADLLGPAEEAGALMPGLEAGGRTPVGDEAIQAWRVLHGLARFPWDLTPDSLPHEAAFEHAIDFEKGCYLGQEAVARVRNLGHPAWVVLHLRADAAAGPGTVLLADGVEAGQVTSAARNGDGEVLLARIRWKHRHAPLSLPDGRPVETSGMARGMA